MQFLVVVLSFLFCFGVGFFCLFSAIERDPFRIPDKSIFCVWPWHICFPGPAFCFVPVNFQF